MTTRRVLVCNHFAAPVGEPGGTRHVELADRFEHWDTVVLAADHNLLDGSRRVAQPPAFEVVRVPGHSGNGPGRVAGWLAYGAGVGRAAKRLGPFDAVVGSSPHLPAAAAAQRVASKLGVPFVFEVRDPWPEVLAGMGAWAPTSPAYRGLARLARRLEGQADAVVVLSEGVGRLLVGRGVPDTKVHVIPNGADPDALLPPAPRPELRRRLGWGDDEVVAVYTGAHGPANGLDLLLDAAAELAGPHPAVRVVLVGDGVEKARLQQRTRDEGLATVRFLDPVPKSELPTVLGAADVGVHCLADSEVFHWGVSPNKLFDYLGAGRAVVTNTPGEVSTLVREAGAGRAVPPGGLADGIAELAALAAPARDALGAAGRTWLGTHRSRAVLAARFEAVLDQVVAARGAR
jgi:glycosyltransferase involved in cell wall biosynthesis